MGCRVHTAMRKVAAEYPGDLDIKSVFVEAIMNETPWQMWNLDTGKISEGAGTAEARTLLEGAFETMPRQLGPSQAIASLCASDGDVTSSLELALRAGDRPPPHDAGCPASGVYADPYRCPLRQLSRCTGL